VVDIFTGVSSPFKSIAKSQPKSWFRSGKKGVNMETYAYEITIGKSGVLTLENLPFSVGEKVEVIIIPRSKIRQNEKRYPFWGKPITYINPTDPVGEADWEVYK